MPNDLKNNFFDINKFPSQSGIIVFPISMSKISNSQSAKSCLEYIEHFTQNRKAILKPHVGLNFIYGDSLYFHSNERAKSLRDKFIPLMINHKFNFLKIISKNPWYVQHAFEFETWSQVLLQSSSFLHYFGELKKIYKKDKQFQKYLLEDLKSFSKKKLDENQLDFFLEEILFFYLVSKGEIKLSNPFVQGHEKWTLFCYPGPPLKSEIYIFQKNPFKLSNKSNKFENSYYDLINKKLYDYDRVDLETIEF